MEALAVIDTILFECWNIEVIMTDDTKKQLEQLTHQIICYRTISKLLSGTHKEVQEVLNTLVHLLPEGWQYSTETCARVSWNDMVVESVNYEDTPWKQSTQIYSGDDVIGTLEVCYLKEMPKAQEGPFTVDERILLDTVGSELGNYLERRLILQLKNQQHRELELYSSLLRHDLRNDVGVIVGNIEIAKMTVTETDEIFDQLVNSTEAVCERMMNLLNLFGRAENIIDTNPITMIEKIVTREEASSGMKIIVEFEKDVKGVRIPESKLLPLIFDNLLRNVTTHARPSPTVTIRVSREDRNLRIIVEDDGPGIAIEVKDKLFHKGVSTRGGGLGLYLSRHVVETMGGSIELIESKPGMGATFEIILPILR